MFAGTLIKDINGISTLLIDSVAMIIYVGLIIFGIWKNNTLRS
jgi:hypothetical protein